MISVEVKKKFVRFVLKHHKFIKLDCVWALEFLLENDEVLENVSFTEKASLGPRNMVVSTTGVQALPFRYEDETVMTGDSGRAVTEMRLRKNEKLYVLINYPDSHKCPMYASVFEDNPYLANSVFGKQVKEFGDRLVGEMEQRLIDWEFDRLVNAALDTGDNAAFMYLTTEFKKMGEEV